MNKKKFVLLIVLFSVLLGTLIANAKNNIYSISNIKSGVKKVEIDNNDVELYNWVRDNDKIISLNDPQIVINTENIKVRDIYFDTYENLSSLNPVIYFIGDENDGFSEEFTLQASFDNNRLRFNEDINLKKIRVDLFDDSNHELHLKRIILNYKKIDFYIVSTVFYSFSFFAFFMLIALVYLKKNSFISVLDKKDLIITFVKNDIKMRYVGSALGVLWAFIQPITTMLVLWIVFQFGLKSAPISNVPFILWLLTGMIPWFFFSDALANVTNTFSEYSYLIKKVKFQASILPFVKILSAFVIHNFFILTLFIIYTSYGYKFELIMVQCLYYSFALFSLLVSLSLLVSSITVFFKDFGQIITVILQLGFWSTPILWDYNIMSPEILMILKLNPVYYIVQGFRDSFIEKIWFYQHPTLTVYYWAVTISLFILGIFLYKKLRPHFADVI